MTDDMLEDCIATLRLVLLFHSSPPWDAEKSAQWKNVTGSDEATTKVLCDFIYTTLMKVSPPGAAA